MKTNNCKISFFDCEISVLNDKEISYEDDMEREAKGKVRLNDLTRKTVERLEHWVRKCEDKCEQPDLELLGRHLYEVLFDEGESKTEEDFKASVRYAFERTYEAFKKKKKHDERLRVVLSFHEEAKELMKLPWEFIYIPAKPSGGFFLAGQETSLILTRYVPRVKADKFRETKQRDILPEVKHLRIFLLECQPKEYASVKASVKAEDLEKMIKEIQELGKNADGVQSRRQNGAVQEEEEGGIIIRYEKNLTYDDLKEQLRHFKPHIFHFIGHGKPGHLFLIKDEGAINTEAAHLADQKKIIIEKAREEVAQGDPRNSKDVSLLFTDDKPRLVFLESCSSAEESLEGLSSVARDLVRSGIPSVVAMQYPIKNDEVSLFARTVYRELGNGKNIDEAVTAGRKNLGEFPNLNPNWSKRSFGTPVIYLQTEQRIVLPSEAPQGSVKCPGRRIHEEHYVDPTFNFCNRCGEALTFCPSKHLMSKTAGKCFECGYTLKSRLPRGGAKAPAHPLSKMTYERRPTGGEAEAAASPLSEMIKRPAPPAGKK